MQEIKEITSALVSGKRVILRAGLNVPLSENEVTDSYRLQSVLPTLRWLHEQKAKIIIIAHLGREGKSIEPVASKLQSLCPDIPMRFFKGSLPEALKASFSLNAGECLILENIRNYTEEIKNDLSFARALADLGDLYVNEAFADSHREHASVVGIPLFLPAYAGICMMSEIAHLTHAINPPHKSIAIIGGSKFETKEPILEKLISRYEYICLGGVLGNDMLKARGLPVGSSVISETPVPVLLAEEKKIIPPIDGLFLNDKEERNGYINDIRMHEKIVDIGTRTIQEWSTHITDAPFVLWNGPVGLYEKGFKKGTFVLGEALMKSSSLAIIGGGDTIAALADLNLDPSRIFLSTGGGAMLSFLSQGTLVGIEALKQAF